MQKTGKILSVILALVMLTGLVSNAAFAYETNAVVEYADGRREGFSSFAAAWKAAVAGNNATVELYASYLNHAGENSYVVPAGKTVTVEMCGNVLSRNITSSRSDGSVFEVKENATLIVYGGTKGSPDYKADEEHDLPVYVANADRLGYTRRNVKLYGGVIHGGNSSACGGGILMRESAKVYLYNVTVAGNYADRSGASYGDGGGVEMNDAYGYLYLEDSKICYNGARYDGGGVHVDSEYCTVKMVRSHIDHNVADDNGGGIYVDGDVFKLYGDAEQFLDPETVIEANGIGDWNGAYDYFMPVNVLGSSVSYNCVFDSEDGGGGIYADNATALIEGVNIAGNIANDDGSGGGVYLNDEGITVRSCNILRNKAEKYGGGICDYDDDNVVDSCTIYGNQSWSSYGAGGGVFVPSSYDLAVSGPVIVRSNHSQTGDDNLYLSSSGTSSHACLIPSTSPGADIHVRLNSNHSSQISKSKGTYDIAHFSYDNDSSHYIGWNSAWNDRVLKVMSGTKPARPAAVTFTPDAGRRTQTVAGGYTAGGTAYDLLKGVFCYPSFPDDNADLENVFYYSDGFFAGSPNDYNEHLATASLCLAAASGYSNLGNADGKRFDVSLDQPNDYLDKSRNFRQFVSDIGCADEDIFVNDFNLQKPGADTVGVGIASKDIVVNSVTKKLVIIGVRGMGYESEWISNMTLGESGEAAGWSSAATQVMAELKAYLARRGIDGTDENTIFWIAGYSRAGATSNLTAKRIVDTYDNFGTHTFAYPLEAPMGGIESLKIEGNNYHCIHNVINQNDIVPWVGTTEMGFIRYGVDHYVPGSPATHAPSDGKDNNKIPEDNAAWDVEGGSYQSQKPKMLAQLAAVNPDILFDDYFHQATVYYILGLVAGFTDPIDETTDYENEMGTTEHFIEFFFKKLQEYAFKYDLDGNEVNATQWTPREYFSRFAVKNNRSFQQAAASTAALIFGKSDEDVAGLMDCFAGLASRLGKWDQYTLYCNIDDGDDIDDLEGEINNLWAHLITVNEEDAAKGYRPISDFLTDAEYAELKACFKSLLFPLLCFAGEDNAEWDQDILGTMAHNIPRIISNHYPEVTHAWLRSYDSLYKNDTAPVTMAASVKTAPSAVAVEVNGTNTYDPASGAINVRPDDVVRLIPAKAADRNAGEAIYYQFTSGKLSVRGVHAFAEPFRLNHMIADYADENGLITLLAVAAHGGQKLEPVTITLKLVGDATCSVPGTDGAYTEVPLKVGQRTELKFIAPDETETFSFKEWKVYSYESGTRGDVIGPELYAAYFGPDFNAKAAETAAANLAGVSARFEPDYDRVAQKLTVSFSGEAGGGGLPSAIDCVEAGGATLDTACPISWDYRTDADTTPYYIGSFSITLPENVTLPALTELTVGWEGLSGYQIQNPTVENLVISGQRERARFDVRFSPGSGTDRGAPALLTGAALRAAPEEQINGNRAVVHIYDLNLGKTVGAYTFYSDSESVSVSAPAIKDMEFMMWQDTKAKQLVREASDNGELVACYTPVVNEIEVTLDGPLAAGEELPGMEQMTVTVSNVWGIDEGVQFEWVGSDTAAAYDTAYTARIRMDMDRLTGANLSVAGSGSQALSGAVTFAETAKVVVKDTNGKTYTADAYLLGDSLWIAFEKTPRPEIVRFAPVSVSAENGSDAMQSMAYAYLADGRMMLVNAQPDVLGDFTVAAGAMLTGSVTVPEPEQTAVPAATPSGGEYQGAQEIRLTAEEGAVIRYAIAVTDNGALPDTSALSYREYTGPFTLTGLGKTTFLFAYAEMAGREKSVTIRYIYNLSAAPASDPGAYVPPAAPPQKPETPAAVDFIDVGEKDWFYDAVQYVAQRGFFLGTGENMFSPDTPMTRGMFMTVLARMNGETIDGADWLEKGMAWAVENGVSDGSAPERPISRQEIVTMLWRFAGSPEPKGGLSGHPDGDDVDPWAAKAAAWAVENGVMNGDQNAYLHLRDNATRAEVAQFVMNYIAKMS